MDRTTDSYDRIAGAYADHFFDELRHKPFDRCMLDWLLARCGAGRLCDLGCGPGQVAAYLATRGADVCGIDLSPAQVAEARRRVPGVAFDVGDLLDLRDVPDDAFAGIAAFYAIVHLDVATLPIAFREMRRVLAPGGRALVAFHVGDEVRHLDELLGRPVDLDFHFFAVDDVATAMRTAGLETTELLQREPYPGREVATRRAYVWSRRPDA